MEGSDKVKTAYAYARFSSDNQREESIDAQLRAIREYAQKEDIKILRAFVDEAYSARTDKRPAFQDMFGLIKENPADYVIVHKLDRFARNRADAAFYRGKLREVGMRLLSVLERLDDSPESIIMEGLLDSMSEYYSANLSREAKKGIKENVMNGKRNGAKPPFGYSSVNQHLVPNGDAERVKAFFRMYADGKRLADIAEALNLPFKNYNAVLKNEVYLGTLISGEWRKENAHEAIIDLATFEQCQRRMKNSPYNAANRAKVHYLLSGLLVCGYCGRRMVATTSGKGKYAYFYYSCRTKGCPKYRREALTERVLNELTNKIRPTDEIKARFYDIVCERVNRRQRNKEAEKLRLNVRKRIEMLIGSVQYAETPEDARAIMEKVNELRRQMPTTPKPQQPVSREACDDLIERIFDIRNLGYDEQKSLLKSCVDKIVVKQDELFLYTIINGEGYIIINENGIE